MRQSTFTDPQIVQTLKRSLQSLLKQAGVYNRLKSSCLYDLYWSMADRTVIEARSQEVKFYRDLLEGIQDGDWIFDIGANHGYKTDIFLRLGARVLAVDPDQVNQEALEDKFLRYRWERKSVIVLGKAVSDKSGLHEMWIEEPGSAKNTLSKKWVDTLRDDESRFGQRLNFAEQREVETITLEDLIALYGTPVFIKIDVEGYEPQVLRGLKRPVPYLSFEVNLPEFREEGLECIDLLGSLAAHGMFNYSVDCQKGLAMDTWLMVKDFREVFNSCAVPSLEVFWKTTPHSTA